jgi:hypothetical protein
VTAVRGPSFVEATADKRPALLSGWEGRRMKVRVIAVVAAMGINVVCAWWLGGYS